jgi:superoxide dismutase, Fe-Mn family
MTTDGSKVNPIRRRQFLTLLGSTIGWVGFSTINASQPGAQASPSSSTPENPFTPENRAIPVPPSTATAIADLTYPFVLPPLPYANDALEPYIDQRTMQIHHDLHHAAYIKNLNVALAKYPDLQTKNLATLLRGLNKIPEEIRATVRNNGGGH